MREWPSRSNPLAEVVFDFQRSQYKHGLVHDDLVIVVTSSWGMIYVYKWWLQEATAMAHIILPAILGVVAPQGHVKLRMDI